MSTPKLILFDIDGTLILTGGAGQRALNRAFEDLFGVAAAFAAVPMAGRTDPVIIAEACARHGVDGALPLSELHERYFAYLAEELPRDVPGKRVLPGVVDLLDSLREDPAALLGLLTGNLARSARLKLEHFDLWHYFRTGAFGDDAATRNELVPVAAARVAALGGPEPRPGQTIVIGDTPHDVACARAAGVRCLAVATGSARTYDLLAAGADVVLEDLGRTDDVLAVLDQLAGMEPMGN